VRNQTSFVPIASKAVGFETDSESDETFGFETDSDVETQAAPVAVKALVGFETDSDDESLLVLSQPSTAVEEAKRILAESDSDEDELVAPVIADDDSEYSYYSDDDAAPASLAPADKGKEEVEDVPVEAAVDPFADKFSSSDEEAENEEIVQRLTELEATSNSVRSRWEQITNAELPKLSVMRASVKDVKAWVAQLSNHSKMARKVSQELLTDSTSALSELEELSNTLTQ
jgi:hypothetical protein